MNGHQVANVHQTLTLVLLELRTNFFQYFKTRIASVQALQQLGRRYIDQF